MKRAIVFLMIIGCFLLYANPKALKYGFSEIQIIDQDNWYVELYNFDAYFNAHDSLYLGSSDGRAQITLIDSSEIVVIEPNDLSRSLRMNRDSDHLKLYVGTEIIDEVKVGDYEGSYIHDLDSTQSVVTGWYTGEMYFKDNTPSIGEYNTTEDCIAHIYGYFYGLTGEEIKDIYFKIYLDQMVMHSEYIDSTGFYTAHLRPRYHTFSSFTLWRPYEEMLLLEIMPVQFDLEPGDSTQVDFHVMQSSITPVIQNTIKFNNYPHPASAYTWFYIENTDVEASAMRVNVYALNGRKVDSFIPAAKHFRYDCSHLPQGSYVMSLQQGRDILATKKLQILK